MTAAPVVPPTPIVTVPDVVVTTPSGTPAAFNLPAAVSDLVPESIVLIQPNETPTTEATTDDGTRQVKPDTGEVVFTPPSPATRPPSPSPPSSSTAPP